MLATADNIMPEKSVSNPASLPQIAVTRLRMSNYRNYEIGQLETNSKSVLLTGPNGAGKTNLLEAISFLAPGRGLRRAKTSEIDRVGSLQPWAISAEVNSAFGPISIGTGRDHTSERRLLRINGAPVKAQSELGEYVSVVWLTPQMDRLFADGPGARRRFLDRLIYGFDPAHAGRCNAYEKALRDRAKLLKEGVQDDIWLNALETQLTERGIAIAAARREIAARLDLACKEATGPFPGADICVEGVIEGWLGQMSALEVEENLRHALKDGRRQDRETGGASIGPHKSDMVVHHLEKNILASFCSTGEQKALLVAIIIAHTKLQTAERGQAPMMLLDEVAAHLDEAKRAALFETIIKLGVQAWVTGTDTTSFEALRGQVSAFQVEESHLKSTNFN